MGNVKIVYKNKNSSMKLIKFNIHNETKNQNKLFIDCIIFYHKLITILSKTGIENIVQINNEQMNSKNAIDLINRELDLILN